MAVTIKSQREIELMRESCKILADVFSEMEKAVHPGVSTLDINNLGEKLIRAHGCIPNFLNYNGYPASICVSVKEEVVHGIPHNDHILHEGDMARTFPVGQVSEEARLLMERTKGSFFAGIEMAKAGNHLYDISNAIDAYIRPFGYGIVRDLVGHGIGTSLHEDPQIPNFAQHRRGLKLQAGMTLANEPLINIGRPDVAWLDDDWTVVTEDGSLSAHYENTILITDGEPEILTMY